MAWHGGGQGVSLRAVLLPGCRDPPLIPMKPKKHEATHQSADSWTELAARLGINRVTLWKHRKRPGAPKEPDHEAWTDFLEAREERCAELAALRLRKLLAAVAEKEHKVAELKAAYVPMSEVQAAWRENVVTARRVFYAEFVDRLPPLLAGMDAAEIQKVFSEAIDRCCLRLHRGEPSS